MTNLTTGETKKRTKNCGTHRNVKRMQSSSKKGGGHPKEALEKNIHSSSNAKNSKCSY
jgi:hypothetical protein